MPSYRVGNKLRTTIYETATDGIHGQQPVVIVVNTPDAGALAERIVDLLNGGTGDSEILLEHANLLADALEECSNKRYSTDLPRYDARNLVREWRELVASPEWRAMRSGRLSDPNVR